MTASPQSLRLILFAAAAAIASPALAQRRPLPVPDGVVAHRDLAYATDGHERQKLDLYLPERAGGDEAPLPLIVWVHGGGWQGGNKAWCPPVAAGFLKRGFAAA
ncbi:MAG: esterase, partial [Planctomycetota bacterium]